ncbi:MAG: ATP-binding protein [candidate division KSB1 bacterium]|nr:ATP-binding protein [candidate division KSB1 bacterium]
MTPWLRGIFSLRGGRSLTLALVLVFVLVMGAVLLDYWTARRELVALARDHALELAAAIEQGGVLSLLALDTVEEMLLGRLISAARSVESLARHRPLAQQELHRIAKRESLDVIVLWREEGTVAFWPSPPPEGWSQMDEAVAALLESEDGEQADVLETADDQWYRGMARGPGGVVVVGCRVDRLLPFRKQIGVGTMIRNIARSEEIVYIALQDTLGILAATGNVFALSSIASDSALSRALRQRQRVWRQTTFGGERVFEAVRPFPLGQDQLALLRVGVSQAPLRSAQARMVSRILVSTLVLLLAGTFAVAYLWTSQIAAQTRRAYHSVRTLSAGILERMGDGVVAVDREGRLLWANPAAERILGEGATRPGEPLGQHVPGLAEVISEALNLHASVEERELRCRLSGKERVLKASASVLPDEEGKPEGAFAVFRDLTEQMRLEQQLARERRLTAMGQLASSIAHEVRNPLNAISVVAQRLAREFVPQRDEEEYQSLTRALVTETRRVNDIVRQFLEFARPPQLNKCRVDLREVVHETADLMRSAAAEKGIDLVTRAGQRVVAEVDANQLKQALVNLVQNAIQACREGDQILLLLEDEEDEVRISVSDTGSGIPPDVLPKIFDLYFTTRPEGTGIGLSLVHRIVSAHDGSIDVRSQLGQGTTFVLHLPRGGSA